MDEELIGNDYFTKPVSELVNHPDYSEKAYRTIIQVLGMTSAQLEKLNLMRGDN